jgi:hypothetical protein
VRKRRRDDDNNDGAVLVLAAFLILTVVGVDSDGAGETRDENKGERYKLESCSRLVTGTE